MQAVREVSIALHCTMLLKLCGQQTGMSFCNLVFCFLHPILHVLGVKGVVVAENVDLSTQRN